MPPHLPLPPPPLPPKYLLIPFEPPPPPRPNTVSTYPLPLSAIPPPTRNSSFRRSKGRDLAVEPSAVIVVVFIAPIAVFNVAVVANVRQLRLCI